MPCEEKWHPPPHLVQAGIVEEKAGERLAHEPATHAPDQAEDHGTVHRLLASGFRA